MNVQCESPIEELYDVFFVGLSARERTAHFSVEEAQYHLACPASLGWTAGTIGRLRLPCHGMPFGFYPYPDQGLRRVPVNDDPDRKLWGWRIDTQHFVAKAGVVPGKGGEVVSQDTETVVLEIPREFIQHCGRFRLHPTTVLRGFIADLCELMSWRTCPREDGYSSNRK